MSKSAESDGSRINLLDSPDAIASKLKRAKTDAFVGLEFDNPERAEARNLLTIYSLVTGYSMARTPGPGQLRWVKGCVLGRAHPYGHKQSLVCNRVGPLWAQLRVWSGTERRVRTVMSHAWPGPGVGAGGRWAGRGTSSCWQIPPIPHQALLSIFKRHPVSIRAWLKGFVLRAQTGRIRSRRWRRWVG